MEEPRAIDLVLKAIEDRGWGQNQAEEVIGLPHGMLSHCRKSDKRPGAFGRESIEVVLGVPRSVWWTPKERELFAKALRDAEEADANPRRKNRDQVPPERAVA